MPLSPTLRDLARASADTAQVAAAFPLVDAFLTGDATSGVTWTYPVPLDASGNPLWSTAVQTRVAQAYHEAGWTSATVLTSPARIQIVR